MPDDYNLIQRIAEAGGNASGFCSAREAREFLAMYRAIQEHDQRAANVVPLVRKADAEEDVHPWERLAR